jgi:hypothetical protein
MIGRSAFGASLATLAALALAGGCVSLEGLNESGSSAEAGAGAEGGADGAVEASPCSDTQSDAKNCGRCGHDCLGGTCQAGVCQPLVLALGQPNPEALVITASAVYWTNLGDGTVAMVSLDGGSPRVIASGQSPRGLATDGQSLYWTNVSGGTIARSSLSGGPVDTIASGLGSPYDLAVSGSFFAWVDREESGSVTYETADRTMGVLLATAQKRPTALALDGDLVWFLDEGSTTSSFTDGQLARVSRTTLTLEPLETSLQHPRGLAVESGVAYFTVFGSGAVMRRGGSGAASTIASSQFQPAAIAVGGGIVYWVNEYEGGAVMQVSKDGGPPKILAPGQHVPHAIAVDDKSIVWASTGDGKIQRLAKP